MVASIQIKFFSTPHAFTGSVPMYWIGNNNWNTHPGTHPENGWQFQAQILPFQDATNAGVKHWIGGFVWWNASWSQQPGKIDGPIVSGVQQFQQLFTTGARGGNFFSSNL